MCNRVHFKNIQVRVANATGISRRSLSSIINEFVSTESHSTAIKSNPKKRRAKQQFPLDIDDFDYYVCNYDHDSTSNFPLLGIGVFPHVGEG